MLLCSANAFNVPTCAYISWCVRAAVAPPRPEPTQKIQCNFHLDARGEVQNGDKALERRVKEWGSRRTLRPWNWISTSVTQKETNGGEMLIASLQVMACCCFNNINENSKSTKKDMGWECYRFATTAGPRALAGFSAPWLAINNIQSAEADRECYFENVQNESF